MQQPIRLTAKNYSNLPIKVTSNPSRIRVEASMPKPNTLIRVTGHDTRPLKIGIFTHRGLSLIKIYIHNPSTGTRIKIDYTKSNSRTAIELKV